MIIFDNPATVPAPAGQYSHVARVELGGKAILQLSGQAAIDADGKIVGNDMTSQADFIMDNITAILAAHGATLADVLNVRTYGRARRTHHLRPVPPSGLRHHRTQLPPLGWHTPRTRPAAWRQKQRRLVIGGSSVNQDDRLMPR